MDYPTRRQYLDGEISHQDYYLSVAKAAHIAYDRSSRLPQIKAALADGDEHLNTIPLAWWDMVALQTRKQITAALKLHFDNWCLASGVCTHKAAARAAAMEEKGS